MKAPLTLADEILAVLPAHASLQIGQVVVKLSVDRSSVRAAFQQLDSDGKAKIVRRGRGGAFHLVPIDYPGRICVICQREFTPVRAQTVTCSHSCARHLAWQNEDMRERHRASVRKAKSTPEAKRKASKLHRRRCADPQVRKRMSEVQRRAWANPETKAARRIGMELAWEDAPERRAKASRRKLRQWKTKAFREKTVAGMHNSKRCRDRRRVVELAKANPEMTPAEIGSFAGRTADSVVIVLRRARRNGEIGPRIGDGPRLRRKAPAQSASAPQRSSAASASASSSDDSPRQTRASAIPSWA